MGHDARRWVCVAAWPLAGFTACVLVTALVLTAVNASWLGTVRTGADLLAGLRRPDDRHVGRGAGCRGIRGACCRKRWRRSRPG